MPCSRNSFTDALRSSLLSTLQDCSSSKAAHDVCANKTQEDMWIWNVETRRPTFKCTATPDTALVRYDNDRELWWSRITKCKICYFTREFMLPIWNLSSSYPQATGHSCKSRTTGQAKRQVRNFSHDKHFNRAEKVASLILGVNHIQPLILRETNGGSGRSFPRPIKLKTVQTLLWLVAPTDVHLSHFEKHCCSETPRLADKAWQRLYRGQKSHPPEVNCLFS